MNDNTILIVLVAVLSTILICIIVLFIVNQIKFRNSEVEDIEQNNIISILVRLEKDNASIFGGIKQMLSEIDKLDQTMKLDKLHKRLKKVEKVLKLSSKNDDNDDNNLD